MRTGRRLAALLLPVLLGVLVLVLSACGSDGSSKNASSTSTTKPTTSSTTAGSTTTAPSSRCRIGELSLSLGTPSPGAGQIYIPLVLRNSGSRTCTVFGYPGVSLLDASSNQIGQPATREPTNTPTTITLTPGSSASSALHTINEGISTTSPCLVPSTQVRVYPPDETQPIVFPGVIRVCGGVFSVTALVPGTTGTS